MESLLLRTKLQVPVIPLEVVARLDLRSTLEVSVPQHRLTLLCAPAGYGKTTLLADWARNSNLAIAWLSLAGDEDGVIRFLRYLLVAWERVHPNIVTAPLGLLLGSLTPDVKSVLAAFLEAAHETTGHLVVIIDDYHLVRDRAIHEAISYLVDYLPAQVHFVLASRADPPLPLARYRARRQLLELRTADIQFTSEESGELLRQLLGPDLSAAQASALHEGSEGWAAGLQLAALSLRRSQGNGDAVVAISGRQRWIADYLAQDVLQALPVDQQVFLLKTSILDQMCASLAEAVTGHANAQAALERLERENLFILPLDELREWYRYHSLFADFLRDELERRLPGEVGELHRRAACWYVAQDMAEAAFAHAVQARDVELVVEVFSDFLDAKLMSGEMKVVERWIESLPQEWYVAYPILGLGRAGFLAFTGALDQCLRCVDEVEQRLIPANTDQRRRQLGRVTAVRCMLACIQNDLPRALDYGGRALQSLPDDDVSLRPGVFAALGDVYRKNGRWSEARNSYLNVLEYARSPSARVQIAHVYGALADLALGQGQLREADGFWVKAAQAIQAQGTWSTYSLPVIGWVYIRRAEILYEWNRQADALDHVARGLKRAEMGGDVRTLIAGYLAAGNIALVEGDDQAAAGYLEHARPLVERAAFSEWTARFERFQLQLWLAQGETRQAIRWAEASLQEDAIVRPENEPVQLAVARVLIVKGDGQALDQASALLARLLPAAEREGRTGVEIELVALLALIEWSRGQRAAAMTRVERALRLAEPEGYVRLFAGLGLPMARLLQEARTRGVMSEYVDQLLPAFAGLDSAALPEPLTPREQEVLELIAAGLTAREIAQRLVISPETAKKHTGNIYGKLGVTHRTEAIGRARALDLLG